MRTVTLMAASLAAMVLVAGVAGCSPETMKIDGPDATLPADEGSPGFLDRMASQAVVSENDALRGILMMVDGKDEAKTFKQRAENLAGRGVLAGGWDHQAERPVTKGRLAYMIYTACKIRGGVVLMLTGPSQRYCLRELQYLHMMAGGSFYEKVTGMEFVAVLSRGDIFLRTGELPDIMEAIE